MRTEITHSFERSPDVWQVNYLFAGTPLAMTVPAHDTTEARRIATEQLARYEIKAV
jgi:hypothetical protein